MSFVNRYTSEMWSPSKIKVYHGGAWKGAVLKQYDSTAATWVNLLGVSALPFTFMLADSENEIVIDFTCATNYYMQLRWRINAGAWNEHPWTLFYINGEYQHSIDKASNSIVYQDEIEVQIRVKAEATNEVSFWKTKTIEAGSYV